MKSRSDLFGPPHQRRSLFGAAKGLAAVAFLGACREAGQNDFVYEPPNDAGADAASDARVAAPEDAGDASAPAPDSASPLRDGGDGDAQAADGGDDARAADSAVDAGG